MPSNALLHRGVAQSGSGKSSDGDGDAPGANAPNPQAALQRAQAQYAGHPEWVTEFNALTGNQCAGDGGLSYRALRNWQATHGLPVDGMLGSATLRAARKAAGIPEAPAPPAHRDELASRFENADSFVPAFKATAYSESNDMRKESDPYAVGAITHPTRDADLGGKSYGTYQFESGVYADGTNAGKNAIDHSTLMSFLEFPKNPYGPGLLAIAKQHGIASREFDARWSELSQGDNKAFGEAQEAFLESTVEGKVTRLMDVAQIAPGARTDKHLIDVMIGTVNQYGGMAEEFALDVAAQQRSAGRAFTADEAGQALQESKARRVEANFRRSPGSWKGIRERIDREQGMFEVS